MLEFGLADGRVEVVGVHPGTADRLALSPDDIGALLATTAALGTRFEAELPDRLRQRDHAYRLKSRWERYPLTMIASEAGRVARQTEAQRTEAALLEGVARLNLSRIQARFHFGTEAEAAYLRLALAFERLSRVQKVWRMTQSVGASTVVMSNALRRSDTMVAPSIAQELDCGVPGLSFSVSGEAIDIYPGFLLIRVANTSRAVTALEVSLALTELDVIEPGSVPSDARRQGSIWEMANKDGTRDKRYANNKQIPVLRMGRLTWSAPGEAPRTYLVSDVGAAEAFATAFAAYQAALFATSREPPAPRGRAMLRPAMGEVTMHPVIAAVPPPPTVSRAYEFLVAPMVGALVLWLATAAPMAPATHGLATAAAPVERPAPAAPPPVVAAETPPPALPTSLPILAAANETSPISATGPAPAPSTRPSETGREQLRTRAGANVRAQPNGTSEIVRTISMGAHLNVFGRAGGWVRIGEADAWGWIHSSLLEVVN